MKKITFYHAGCPVCISVEHQVLETIDTSRYELDVVHLGEDKSRIAEAESAGVESVPAMLLDSGVFHINFGATLSDVKGV